MNTLNFRTEDQRAIYELELRGQLSDGKWENSSNTDPWWRDVKVSVNPDDLGRDFYARKDTWNFNAKDLLDVVWMRMVGQVNLVRALGFEVVDEKLRWVVSCSGTLIEHYKEKIGPELWARAEQALKTPSYGLRDLQRDLKEMKAIIKIKRAPACGCHCKGGCCDPYAACARPCREHMGL